MDAGVRDVLDGLLVNTSVRTLYLDANGITDALPFASYFNTLVDEGRVGVTRLWLSMNRLGDFGVSMVCRCLKDYVFLEGVSLGSNGCSAAVAQEIYESFKDHPRLRFLDLGMYKATADLEELTNRIGDEGIEFICKLVQENTSIQVLSVSCNGVTQEGLARLAAAVKENHSLIHVEYFQYGLQPDRAITNRIDTQVQLNAPRVPSAQVRFIKHSSVVKNTDSVYL